MASFELTIRVMLSLIFFFAVAGKVRTAGTMRSFTESVAAMSGFTRRTVALIAAGVVIAELSIAPLLLLPRTAVLGLACAAALLTAFSVAMVAAMRSGRRVACRCFGGDGSVFDTPHLVRNIGLLVLAVTGLAAALTTTTAQPRDLIVAVPFGAAGAFLAMSFVEFLMLFRRPDPQANTRLGR